MTLCRWAVFAPVMLLLQPVFTGLAAGGDLADRLGVLPPAGGDAVAAVAETFGAPVRVSAKIEPGQSGNPDVLAVQAVLEEGWHLYSVTQKRGGPKPTRITLAADSPRQTAGPFVPDSPAVTRFYDDVAAWRGIPVEEHHGTVTWRAPLAPGKAGPIHGSLSLQLCRDNSCNPPETIPFTVGSAPTDAARPATETAPPSARETPATARPAEHAMERTHATVRVDLLPGNVVQIEIVPENGWHVYRPADSAGAAPGQGKATILAFDGESQNPADLSVTVKAARPAAAEGVVDGPVVFSIVRAGSAPLRLVLGLQTCADDSCDPPSAVRIGIVGDAVTFADAAYGEAARSPLPLTAPPAPLALPVVLLMGLAGGLLLNLMPCVLPVLGLKLMSFAQQSGRDRREVFQMNLWYCLGVFAVFFALATASVAAKIGLARASLAWGEQFTSTGFNIAMTGIVFAFALSFLGVWELPIPGFIGAKAGHVQSREGPLGAFLKGVLSTVLATPCSGPFLGPVFGFTLGKSAALTYAVFMAIATGMALPYIVVGLVPRLVRFLPRPGAWMATFKEILGFVMLGTVAYLFTFLQHDWFVPTFVMLIGIWLGCWWVGRAQETSGVVGIGRWVQGAIMAAAVGGAALPLLGPVPSLIAWEEPFSRARVADLQRAGATVLVDFTADWCPTCKVNLAFAIETRKVRDVIEKNRVVPLLADWTDGSLEVKQALESLGSRSIPVLAVFPAGRPGESPPAPIVLRDLISERDVLAAIEQAGPSRSPAPEIRAAALP
ncbi:MAG: cytochrome c biogenesis protein CcdA [Planctomycetia bacterium]|jgi:suppressor for copper-sensitivity B